MSYEDTIVLAIEPHIAEQAEKRKISLPLIRSSSCVDNSIEVNQQELLLGLGEIGTSPSEIVLRTFYSPYGPNPSVRAINNDSFSLSYSEERGYELTEKKLSEAFWLGCLLSRSMSSTSEQYAHERHQRRLTLASNGLALAGISTLLLSPDLASSIKEPLMIGDYAAIFAGVIGKIKHIADTNEDYFKKKNTKLAREMAREYPIIGYKPVPEVAYLSRRLRPIIAR